MPVYAIDDLKVLELADERGEFLGRMLAGFGAEVIKVEPPEGSPSRRIGPFHRDERDPEKSLFFWHFNQGKRSVTLDLDDGQGQRMLKRLAEKADILIESHPAGYLPSRGLGYQTLAALNPRLIYCSVTDFGQNGPWAGYKGSDLVLMAMGGPTSHSGYAPDPATGQYAFPPMTPRMWHAYHFTGVVTMLNVMAAIHYRDATGEGQYIDASIHECVANANEFHTSNYLANQSFRGRRPQAPAMKARDGAYVMPFVAGRRGFDEVAAFLEKFGADGPLRDAKFAGDAYLNSPEGWAEFYRILGKFIKTQDSEPLFHAAQAAGLTWSPLRPPEDNLKDPHYAGRGNFAEVDYPELGLRLPDVSRGWVADHLDWNMSRRAPLLGEHNAEVASELGAAWPAPP
jgi:crotonobetainyl-CoA:carnitine CoA-transferase CaiB-like acyl-CoA transferase